MSDHKPHHSADTPSSEATKPKAKLPPPQGSKAPACGTPTPDGAGRVYKTGIWVSRLLKHRMDPKYFGPQVDGDPASTPAEPVPVVTNRTWETTLWSNQDPGETLDRILQASKAQIGRPRQGPSRG